MSILTRSTTRVRTPGRSAPSCECRKGWPAGCRQFLGHAGHAFLFLTALAAPAAGDAQQSASPLAQAARVHRELPAICADFEQIIQVRLARRRIASAGRVCQQQPNFFSMRFADPDGSPNGDLVVSDGAHLWVYYPTLDAEQVMRYPAAAAPGGRNFFRELLENSGSRYDATDEGRETIEGRDCLIVALTPRGRAAYRGARLWLDAASHLICRLEIREESGNVRTVTLRNLDPDPTIDPLIFTFEPPAGARIRGEMNDGESSR